MHVLKWIGHLLVISILTITTQIGGIIWLVTIPLYRKSKQKNRQRRLLTFTFIYTIAVFLIVPNIAPVFGRVPLPLSGEGNLAPHNPITFLCNRHYVTPTLKSELEEISIHFALKHNNLKIKYLDANFPFIDGFPLLPHLSHSDGRKIDLSFMYLEDGKPSNAKPATSGYGFYEHPKKHEINQPKKCIDSGYWQYDYPKYITLGSRKDLEFDIPRNTFLINAILNRTATHKVFIEPHLESRMQINHPKSRYHGCKAVRHDDHIHYQTKQ